MIEYYGNTAMQFDDILLVPQNSSVKSRSDVEISMSELSLPIVAAPMDTVCEYKMANTLAARGGIGFIHRYMDRNRMLDQVKQVLGNRAVAISTADAYDQNYIFSLIENKVKYFCIDTANGHNDSSIAAVEYLKWYAADIHVMAGNVATKEGYRRLSDAGADSIRVGIGGGSACTTRIVTGHGVPTLQSVMDCYEESKSMHHPAKIVADGGLRNSGDIIKAFAAGADWVMLGSMLAGTSDSPGEIISKDGIDYKTFRGMASREAQQDWRGYTSVAEGASTLVKYKGDTNAVIDQIVGGIKSGCSYTGVSNLSDLANSAMFVRVSTNTQKENVPHAVQG